MPRAETYKTRKPLSRINWAELVVLERADHIEYRRDKKSARASFFVVHLVDYNRYAASKPAGAMG
jgi:hypothetical protein